MKKSEAHAELIKWLNEHNGDEWLVNGQDDNGWFVYSAYNTKIDNVDRIEIEYQEDDFKIKFHSVEMTRSEAENLYNYIVKYGDMPCSACPYFGREDCDPLKHCESVSFAAALIHLGVIK